ncbi:MAG: hypothetical protein ACK40L_00175 [Hydrogenophaga sp.]|jgi:hypothetical protein|nr:hypothetical protein [Hydrogenophaga sp.]
MTLLLLEALGALLLLIFIVWWTMFSGRPKGELPADAEADKERAQRAASDTPDATGAPPQDPPAPGR